MGWAQQGPEGSDRVRLEPHRHGPRVGAGRERPGSSANLGTDFLNTTGLLVIGRQRGGLPVLM